MDLVDGPNKTNILSNRMLKTMLN